MALHSVPYVEKEQGLSMVSLPSAIGRPEEVPSSLHQLVIEPFLQAALSAKSVVR